MTALEPPSLRDAYDIVVVGSGSGGAAVTRRLVDAGAEVLLLEAGGDGRADPAITDPTRWMQIAGGPRDWGHRYTPQAALGGRSIPIPRGRVLGGSGATNAMMWYRGHPADYDRWQELGCPGWSHADCLPAFRAAEAWSGPASPGRGSTGPLRIGTPADPHPLALALIDAAEQAGLPRIDDPNGPDNEGAALANLNIHAGRRFGPAEGYLAPVLGAPGLTVALETQALRLLWRGDRAAGVQIAREGAERVVAARHGIVLAAGAFETPRLLMLSGVGPETQLRALGLPVVRAAEAVGDGLQDHPLLRALNFQACRPLPPPRDNGGGAILNWRSAAAPRPDLHAIPVAGRSATPELVARHALPETGVFAIATGLMGSKSRGNLRLTGPDPLDPLHLDPGFLSHPSDRAALREAVEVVLDIAARPALRGWTSGPLAPADGDIDGFVRDACATFFHPCGTARMGSDAEAVTDPRLRLRGMQGVWIADASVIPEIPSCNTHSVATMIGERAAGFILEDLRP
jgi:choline dehydrogenase